MLRLSTFRKLAVALCVFSCIALRAPDQCVAQQEDEEPSVLPLSTAYVAVPGHVMREMCPRTVEWENQDYPARQGATILMEVIVDPATDARMRAKALERLSRLRNRDVTPRLMALYPKLRDWEEKNGVMQCLVWSEDPRGLPLLTAVLDNEQDDVVRLAGAYALARWNVRRGVAELVGLLESDDTLPQGGRMPRIRDNAAEVFVTESRHKGWGFPADRLQQEIGARADLSDDQKRVLYIAEIKKWFAKNKERFPDWRPGDPLPAAPKLPPTPPGPEDVLTLNAAFPGSPVYGRMGRDEGYSTVAQGREEKTSWQGKRYPAAEGLDLLMRVALEPDGVSDRIRALSRLEHFSSRLRHTERIPQLINLYGRLTDRSQKVALLFCLAESKDPRALPLFAEILETRHEEDLRLPAAYGLALWNARRGVGELIELLSFRQTESPIRYPGIIGDKAARLLSRLNHWKSWWAPEAPLQAAFGARPEVLDELLASSHAQLKKWFAANEHRFPEWKLGDPLPKVGKNKESESDGETP